MKIRTVTIAMLAVLALALAACGGGAGDGSNDGGGSSNDATADGSSTDVVEITAPSGAANTGFGTMRVSAPADTPFTIHFVNEDVGIPHDVQIYEGSEASGTPVWAPEDGVMITGPDEVDYQVPALPAGTYTFTCMAHPTTMVGTLTVS